MRKLSLLFLIASLSTGCQGWFKQLPPPPCGYEGVLLLGGDVFYKPFPEGCPGQNFRVDNRSAAGATVMRSEDKKAGAKYLKEINAWVEVYCK